LLDILLFLALSSLVADRTGAAFALARINGKEPWSRPSVADVIQALETDASYLVRISARLPGESTVQP
jgi:hypothetical protein